jgi:hypothetical protein
MATQLDARRARQHDRSGMSMHHRAQVRMSFVKLAMNTGFIRQL